MAIDIHGVRKQVHSIYNELIVRLTDIVKIGAYSQLPVNTPPIEKLPSTEAGRVTTENHIDLLQPGCQVSIPISHRLFTKETITRLGGHDRIIVMTFIGSSPFMHTTSTDPPDLQLNFMFHTSFNKIRDELGYSHDTIFACRASKLTSGYTFPIYVRFSNEIRKRLERRALLFQWRHSVYSFSKVAEDDAFEHNVATPEELRRIREKIRELVATTLNHT